MEIHWKDYKITVNKYSWDLHKKNIMTQEKADRLNKMGKNTKKKTGDITWSDEGFFVSLENLLDTLIKLESSNDSSVVQLSDYLIRWNNIMQGFSQQCKVIK